MRLHHLCVTAFGPFAGTEEVDFDALNDAGLFLLAGATGAGKTSILDAVCFALYGSVPGVRGVKALKSQHAADETRPEVVLEFSVRDRRFRIRRSPEWTRPKRRGTGTATEKAAASLIEITTAGEEFLTSRAAEVGLMVSDLVGMRAAQFHQVALLPQGEFATFLHASSQDRHDVLQHLFQTDRFARIEEWVNDHSRSLRQSSEQGETLVRQLVHTLTERAGVEPPEWASADTSTGASHLENAHTWAQELLASAEERLAECRTRQDESAGRFAAARSQLDAQRRLADAVRRRDAARDALAALAASAEAGQRATDELAAHDRATACRPLLDLLDRAVEEAGRTARSRDQALTRLHAEVTSRHPHGDVAGHVELPEHITGPALEDLETRTRTLLTKVEGLLPRVRTLSDATARQRTAADRRATAEEQRDRALAEREALPERIATARAELAEVTERAARCEALALQVRAAATRAEAAAAVPDAQRRLSGLRDVVRNRRDAAGDARDVVQDLAARRLAGIAAELAGRLEDGQPCQVCGSIEHPARAVGGPDPVTEAEQRSAEEAYDTAQEALLRASEEATAAEARVTELRTATGGLDAATAQAELESLQEALAEAGRAEAGRAATEGRLATLTAELDRVRATVAELDTAIATLRHEEQTAQALAAEVAAEIDAVLGDGTDPDAIPLLAATLDDVREAVTAARTAWVAHERATQDVAELETQAAATATEHGFASVASVRAAVMAPERRARHEQLVASRSEQTAAAKSVLDDAEVRSVEDSPAPDLALAEDAAAAAEAEARATAREFDLQEQRVQALASLVERLDSALTAWAPAHRDFARAESMSRLVRGMGSDNQLQMRLSAYVLATRLDQVLEAANERLSHMRDQRYLLQRTGRAARKGSQAGLGLEVLDQWTGDVRDPATLSGGETFVVSLALALGLADVVTQEAGGTEIETLFVDEGFGTLDADTLDDVMDRLDALRAGGRTVGVVSHVSELRTRISAQVHVRKTPQGSTIHAELLVG